jgi:hypothetical protein
MPVPAAYAMIPQFVYALLSDGVISPSAFALWAMIRLFARDQERNTFSPCSVALTTTQLAELFGSSETHIKNLIRELEAAHALERHTENSSRRLQLSAPVGITGHSIYRLIYLPVTPQEEDLALLTELEATPPPEALSGEGGVGETNYQAPELRVNQMPGNTMPGNQMPGNQMPDNQVPGNSLSPKSVIIAVLRDRGAFPRVAETIADKLIAAGITDPNEVRDLVNAVIQQVLSEGAQQTQVIGRVMARLRNGDWDTGAIHDQALAAAQTAAYARYATANAGDDDAGEDNADSDADDTPQPAATGSSLARTTEAAELWQKTLDAIRPNTTAEIYSTWFSRSRGIGYNGDGNTLVVAAHNAAAAEMLGSRLLQLIQRELQHAAGSNVPVRFVVAGAAA